MPCDPASRTAHEERVGARVHCTRAGRERHPLARVPRPIPRHRRSSRLSSEHPPAPPTTRTTPRVCTCTGATLARSRSRTRNRTSAPAPLHPHPHPRRSSAPATAPSAADWLRDVAMTLLWFCSLFAPGVGRMAQPQESSIVGAGTGWSMPRAPLAHLAAAVGTKQLW